MEFGHLHSKELLEPIVPGYIQTLMDGPLQSIVMVIIGGLKLHTMGLMLQDGDVLWNLIQIAHQ